MLGVCQKFVCERRFFLLLFKKNVYFLNNILKFKISFKFSVLKLDKR